MSHHFSCNDAVLLLSLLYSCLDLCSEWATFSTCSKPVHQWLLVSYCCVVGFRVFHLLGASAEVGAGAAGDGGDGEFLLDLRHKATLPRALVALTWTLALPFFTFWTMLGTSWLWEVFWETPQCMPTATHLWFSGFWLVLCYVWIGVHLVLGAVALVLERRVRRAEEELGALEDSEVLQRWGQVSQLSGYRALADLVSSGGLGGGGGGLSAAAIKALPCETHVATCVDCECPICLADLAPGDGVRSLPGCGHAFHRSCIDLWLLRRADCPLCKRKVAAGGGGEWV